MESLASCKKTISITAFRCRRKWIGSRKEKRSLLTRTVSKTAKFKGWSKNGKIEIYSITKATYTKHIRNISIRIRWKCWKYKEKARFSQICRNKDKNSSSLKTVSNFRGKWRKWKPKQRELRSKTKENTETSFQTSRSKNVSGNLWTKPKYKHATGIILSQTLYNIMLIILTYWKGCNRDKSDFCWLQTANKYSF